MAPHDGAGVRSVPKQAEKLTARGVQAIATPGMHADGRGLYLLVSAAGNKSWIYRFQIRGRRRDMGLGPLDTCGLAEARRLAGDARQQVADGVDPIEVRKQAAAGEPGRTFQAVADAYVAIMSPAWKNAKHRQQWKSTLRRYAYPKIGDRPINAITTDDVLGVLEPVWTTYPETASRLRGRIEEILDHAKAKGERDGENPARWRRHLDKMLPSRSKIAPVVHLAAMPYRDLPAWWPYLQAQDGLGAKAVEFAILTACRSGEVRGMRWDEADLDARIWTAPADRMKSGREHRVPLSDPAVALIRKLATRRRGPLVFHGQRRDRPMSDMTLTATLRRMKTPYTVHGFRSTFRDWAAETTDHPDYVAEMALAHVIAGKVEAAYRRGDLFDKRRRLMEDWAKFICLDC